MTVSIRRLDPGDADTVLAAGHLFDDAPRRDATERFLASAGHHLLLAFEGERAVGFVSGVEMTHPDKGTELFLYELGVDAASRGRGIGSALVAALRDLGRERGCYGMWVLTEDENAAAVATYRSAGAGEPTRHVMLDWALAGDG